MGQRHQDEEGFDALGVGDFGAFDVKAIRFLILEHRFDAEAFFVRIHRVLGPLTRRDDDQRFVILRAPQLMVTLTRKSLAFVRVIWR